MSPLHTITCGVYMLCLYPVVFFVGFRCSNGDEQGAWRVLTGGAILAFLISMAVDVLLTLCGVR